MWSRTADPKQELELGRPDASELLGPQVVRDEPVVAAEGRKRGAALVEREHSEIEPRGPTLGVLVERLGLCLGHLDSGGGEECVRLGVVQRERRGPKLQQLAVGPELREPHPSLRAPGEHQLRALRHVREECDQRVQASVILELVHIVEHEHHRLAPRGQRRAETGKATRPQRVAGACKPLEHGGLDRPVGVQRLGDVRQEDDRIVVAVVERDPGELTSVSCRPLA